MSEERLKKIINGVGSHKFALSVCLFSFFLTYVRPQTTIPFLGTIRFPLVISTLSALCWASAGIRSSTIQTRIMGFFLAVEAARCLLGKLLFDELVRNDRFAFNTWTDLFLQFVGIVFPLVAFGATGKGLRSIQRAWFLVAVLLSIYILTHGGVGPKGFLGDENDAGMALLFLLPLPLVAIGEAKVGMFRRLIAFSVALVLLAGLVSTFSRGAFVGLVCVLTVFTFGTSRKGIAAVLLVTFIGIGSVVIPRSYWAEILSIGEIRTGTAEQRREMWNVATRVWLDPRHILIGVGMENVKFHLRDYEIGSELGSRPSLGGRAVHSIYFQILPDLGIWGLLVVGTLTLKSFRSLGNTRQIVKKLSRRIASSAEQLRLESPVSLERELRCIVGWTTALSACMVGLFSAGSFISILYYPHIWLAFGLCGLIEAYTEKIENEVEELSVRSKTLTERQE